MDLITHFFKVPVPPTYLGGIKLGSGKFQDTLNHLDTPKVYTIIQGIVKSLLHGIYGYLWALY